MKYDGKINIATGMNARTKRWKNKKILWSELVERLLEENPTGETIKEYQSSNKADRSQIKDVGGYVGAYLRDGRRKPENVVYRTLITLDLDFAHLDIWDDFELMYDNAAVMHITHSHTEKTPKFRLIMPLDRECSAEEYVAVARRVAGDIGIGYFDNTGFQPYRLMFWQSHPKDQDYIVYHQDGPFISVDDILATYSDWSDSSEWDTSQAYTDSVNNHVKKQEDPNEKKGIIGAFCRTYGIAEVIEEFLQDHYTEVSEDRYTYAKGSTAGGLIVYENKYAYSHHGTDPISGKLCNAFDLVRVHKFGHLDEDSKATSGKLPSFRAMESFARESKPVKRLIAEENIEQAKYDFAEDYVEDEKPKKKKDKKKKKAEEENLDWTEDLELDARGKYLSTATNISLVIENDKRLKKLFKLNLFDNKRYMFRSPPWRKIKEPEPLREVDYSGLRNYLERIYGIAARPKIEDSLSLELEKNSYHPIRDYLDGLEWDGEERVDNILIKYFGADDNIYTREAFRKMLVGAIARVRNAGTKFDMVLTLVGMVQGEGKSMLINKLGNGWASDTFNTVHGKESFEQLQGAWLIEMAELSGMRKAEVEAVKHFITKQEDMYRPAYGRTVETYKRQCVFFATTNKSDFLRDPTGNRRFNPVEVYADLAEDHVINLKQEEVNQIWAEAQEMYLSGEPLILSKEAEIIAKKRRIEHSEEDDRKGIIVKYLNTRLPKSWSKMSMDERKYYIEDNGEADEDEKDLVNRNYVCIPEIWVECFGNRFDKIEPHKTRQVNEIMRTVKSWEYVKTTRKFTHYGKQRYYVRSLK